MSESDDRIERLEAAVARLQEEVDYLKGLPQSYTIKETAELIGVKERTVRGWCRQGQLKAERDGHYGNVNRQWRVPRDEIARHRREGLRKADPTLNQTNRGLPGETRLEAGAGSGGASHRMCDPRSRQSAVDRRHRSPDWK